jgi:hypothetical protein
VNGSIATGTLKNGFDAFPSKNLYTVINQVFTSFSGCCFLDMDNW